MQTQESILRDVSDVAESREQRRLTRLRRIGFPLGVVAIFLLAIFWKNTTANAAITAAFGSFLISTAFWVWLPSLPFIDRVGIVFLLCVVIGMLVSRLESKADHPDAIQHSSIDTSTSKSFNLASLVILMMLVALYATWW